MFCKNCGKEVDEKAYVCIHCGCKIESEEEKTENPIYPYPTYEGEELSVLLSGPDWSSNESII